jgi:hypothetical protein
MSSLTPEAYAVIEGRPSDPLCKVQGLPDEKTELTRRERIRSEHMYWTGYNSSDARCSSMRRNNGGAGDRRIIRLIQKWLKAGVLEDGIVSASDRGTGKGSVISPLLANIYLHYVLDLSARW